MKRLNFTYQTRLFFLAILFSTAFAANAQQRESLQPQKSIQAPLPTNIVSPFTVSSEKSEFNPVVKEATYLKLDVANLKAAMKKSPREMVFQIPQKNGDKLELLLERQEILSHDFEVTDQKGNVTPFDPGTFYTGQVLERYAKQTSIASLSIAGDEIMAMMNIGGKNYVLGAVRNNEGKKTTDYVFYNDENLQIPNTYECGTETSLHQLDNPMTAGQAKSGTAKNIVRVQFEADYQMYQDFGNSISNTANYVTGLFNMVATIYHQEGIVTQISKIVVWNSADPYGISSSVGSGAVLNKFRDRKNITGITGDLAHLLSTKPVGHGGIAWVDVLCFPTIGYRTAYSNISTTYNNFPLYSWTIDVVTHEMGHNLGSPHTHDCSWGTAGNQALDNCAAPSGGCAAGPAPTNGGTIMSYCHLTSAGKNFNLGFGTQPGNLIRNKVAAATCLPKAFLNCTSAQPIYCGVPVNGTTVGGTNNVNTYGCNSWLQSGPEKVFFLQTTEPGTITASLSNLSADLDVIILDACSESNCLAEGNNTATVANASPGQYFIVVDGYQGAAGSFTLTVNCSGVCYTTGLTNYEFIQAVNIGTISNNSGNNYGYADFTSLSTPLHRGGSADVALTPGFISSSWGEYWRIWIDLNHDDDFNDNGELVFETPTSSSTTVNSVMNIPAWAQLGPTRMRVAMRFGSKPTACGTFSGEVEDYTVDIQEFCPSIGNSKYEFIRKVEIGTLANASGNNGGYGDYTALGPLDLIEGDTIPVKLTPGFSGAGYNERWVIWIDLNQNFHFEVTELVFSGGPSDLPVSGNFIVPSSGIPGQTRMRVTMFYGSGPGSCSYAFWGETEDYTVNIAPFCPSAGNSTYEFIKTVGLGDLLNDSGNDGGYADFTDLTAVLDKSEPVAVALVPGFAEAKYNEVWRIWIDFNKNKIFETEEQVFQAGPSSEMVFGAFNLPESIAEGEYGCRVSMRYGVAPEPCGNFAWGEVEDYTVKVIGGANMGGLTTGRSDNGTPSVASTTGANELSLFPNPVRDVLNITWGGVQPVAGQVVGLTGQTVFSFDETSVPSQIDLNSLPSGLYLLHVITTDQQAITKRFVKAE